MNGLTNATSQDLAWCPKHQTAKWCCWFDGHSLTRLGSQKTWIFISLHRFQIRHSKILLILARPLPIGYFTFYYFSFFLIFNRMDAWSLMRGDAFIHFVCGSRRVNIRLGVLLLIPKSPQALDKDVQIPSIFRLVQQTTLKLQPIHTCMVYSWKLLWQGIRDRTTVDTIAILAESEWLMQWSKSHRFLLLIMNNSNRTVTLKRSCSIAKFSGVGSNYGNYLAQQTKF